MFMQVLHFNILLLYEYLRILVIWSHTSILSSYYTLHLWYQWSGVCHIMSNLLTPVP